MLVSKYLYNIFIFTIYSFVQYVIKAKLTIRCITFAVQVDLSLMQVRGKSGQRRATYHVTRGPW